MTRTNCRRAQTLAAIAAASALLWMQAPPVSAGTLQDEREVVAVSVSAVEGSEAPLEFKPTGSVAPDTAVVPPPSCDIWDVGFAGTAEYLNGVLANLELEAYADVDCPPTAPGQSMWGLGDRVTLFQNGNPVMNGSSGRCDDSLPHHSPCTWAWTSGTHLCAGVQCAGTYQGLHTPYLVLPPGYSWASWPAECTRIRPDTLYCAIGTEAAYVAPTL